MIIRTGLVLLLISLSCASTLEPFPSEPIRSASSILNFLQQEQIACSNAQQSIIQFLRKQQIPIGSEPRSLAETSKLVERIEDRIITSTESNPVECRITLDFAPPGVKCVAPCGCAGSQKWIQFSVLNKLKRKDPKQWIICPTCREKYKYHLFTSYGGLKTAMLGLLLERLAIIRSLLLCSFLIISYFLSLPLLISRYLVSRSFWQLYPKVWQKLVRLPLPFKFWGGKLVLSAISEKYLLFEKNWIVSQLADFETTLIEKELPDIRPISSN